MRKILFVIIAITLSFSLNAVSKDKETLKGGVLSGKVNSDHEDYGAFLVQGIDNDTLFFTSSRRVKKRRKIALRAEMFYSVRPAAERGKKAINKGWSKAKRIVAEDSRIAQYTRGSQAISESRIIFAAERDLTNKKSVGTSFLFDLWQMTRQADGFSNPEPLENINNPDSWESQPALSLDGKVLFFVSNRQGGKGGLDIWYSIRDAAGKWGEPRLVPNINTSGDEKSPHCGADGRFYFSSDWNYEENEPGENKCDIYRANYDETNGALLPINPIPLDKAIRTDAKKFGLKIPEGVEYNSEADDEFPFITRDRKYIFITSNRDADYKKRNLYAFALPKSRIRLQVNVMEKILDSDGTVIQEPTPKIGLNLTLEDLESGTSREIESGKPYEAEAEKTYRMKFSKFVEEECYDNKIEGPSDLKIKTVRPFGWDTLFQEDVLIIRRKIEIEPVVFNSTDTLPYFITGYWYPNTAENIREYRNREATGFFDATGYVDSSGYSYDSIATQINKSFEEKIYEPLEKILPYFQDICRDTLFLKVTVHGYTDPRGLSSGKDHPYRSASEGKREYPDKTITAGVDKYGNRVTIPTKLNMWKHNWTVERNGEEKKIVLPNEGENGNVTLSILRAYFTFVTFDEEMRERSPIYSQLRANNKVALDVQGFGVDKEGYAKRGLRDDPQSRRIEIYLDILRPNELDSHIRLKGGKVAGEKQTSVTAKAKISEKEQPQVEEPEKEVETNTVQKETSEEIKTVEVGSKKTERVERHKFDEEQPRTEVADVNLPPKETEVKKVEKKEEKNFKIYYKAYEKRKDAEAARKILEERGVENPRVVEIIDQFGSEKTYELYSGNFNSALDAIKTLKKLDWTIEELNLRQKPVIIR